MKQTRLLMGMPITIEIVDKRINEKVFDFVYGYFEYVDKKFSTYKKDSEITAINQGKLRKKESSSDMRKVFDLCKLTNEQTNGFFNIEYKGKIDPSGLVKGWSIYNAALLLKDLGYKNFYVNAGGDIQVSGKNENKDTWMIGIENPLTKKGIIKTLCICDKGVATSGTYIRGQHVYNPITNNKEITDVVSITVIGPNIYEADRFATAAFAMGKRGIGFIEKLPGFEGYMVDSNGMATYTSGFDYYVMEHD